MRKVSFIIFILLVNNLFGQNHQQDSAVNNSVIGTYQNLIDSFFYKYERKGTNEALNYIFSTNP